MSEDEYFEQQSINDRDFQLERGVVMDASEVVNKINSLKEVFGDVEVVINAQGYDNGFFKRITDISIQQGMVDDDGNFIDEVAILVTCE